MATQAAADVPPLPMGGVGVSSDPEQMAKAQALNALRRGDLAAAREFITTARRIGATRRDIACLLNIDWEQPDAVLQREIARVLNGQRAVR